MNPKFKIGARVTVAPMDEDEVMDGPMDGVVCKVDTEDFGDGEVYYVVELDECPDRLSHLEPPFTVDAAEWERTTLDKHTNIG